jgi:hypothetical protein
MTIFTEADREFLKSVGISSQPTLEDERLALAQRIAKQSAAAELNANTDAGRLALVRLALTQLLAALDEEEPSPATPNPTLEFLKANGLALNRENYLAVSMRSIRGMWLTYLPSVELTPKRKLEFLRADDYRVVAVGSPLYNQSNDSISCRGIISCG